jgi:quercetin dioxygenase-like cupin family protein
MMNADTNIKGLCRASECETVDVPWGQLRLSAARAIGNSASLTFGRVTILAGHANSRHRHPNCDEILHVLSGRLEHSLGDELFVMEAGDTIAIPTGMWHQARAIGEEDAEIVICFSSADRITEIDQGQS